ncbi:MAG: hypothetical protein MI867_14145, partial [Pseudomonadales bacterium]|nr:hypothetical protein [Pseudomonadales bacterium]
QQLGLPPPDEEEDERQPLEPGAPQPTEDEPSHPPYAEVTAAVRREQRRYRAGSLNNVVSSFR